MSTHGAFFTSGDERIPRCPDHGEMPASAIPPVFPELPDARRLRAAYPAFWERVAQAKRMLWGGATRDAVRELHGAIVLRAAEEAMQP